MRNASTLKAWCGIEKEWLAPLYLPFAVMMFPSSDISESFCDIVSSCSGCIKDKQIHIWWTTAIGIPLSPGDLPNRFNRHRKVRLSYTKQIRTSILKCVTRARHKQHKPLVSCSKHSLYSAAVFPRSSSSLATFCSASWGTIKQFYRIRKPTVKDLTLKRVW